MGGFWIFPFFGLVFMAVILILLFRGGGLFCGSQARRDGRDTPAEIARRRYARGEISREELAEVLETWKR